MRKPFQKSKSLSLTAFGALLSGLLLVSCASQKLGPFNESDINSNIYFQSVEERNNPKLSAKARESAYQLLRATFPAFLKDAKAYSNSNAWLDTLPQGEIFGDIHIQQPTWRDLKIGLDDWDTVSTGPYWLDVLRAEVSALVWTRSLGFRNDYNYPCLDAYTKAFVRNDYVEPQKHFDSFIKPNTEKSQSTNSEWTSAPAIKDSEKALLAAFLKYSKEQSLKLSETTPVRSFSSGVGSLQSTKLIFLDSQNTLWELKEVELAPLASFYEKTSDAASGCSRYASLIKGNDYSASKPKACFEFEGRLFTLLNWSHSYFSLKDKHIQSYDQLKKHTEWVCSELARFHKRSADKATEKKWSMLLKSPAPLQTTLKRMTREMAAKTDEAYRMLLLSGQE